jgi:H+/Cl- antiporter ClcA
MARSIIGVIVGYLVLFALEVVAFIEIYSLMGADWSFKTASYQPSTRWTLVQFIVVFVTAVIGGLVCQLIAGKGKSPLVLAGIVVVVGLALGAMINSNSSADTRKMGTSDIPAIQAMRKAQHPVWVVLANSFLAAVGVIVGGSLKRVR